jgi:hypothetical protein
MLCRPEDFFRICDSHDRVDWRVENEERPAESRYILLLGMASEILYERASDGEGRSSKLHFALATLLDPSERFSELKEDMIGFEWSGDRGDSPHFGEPAGCRQYRGSSEAVPHEETDRPSGLGHRASCADDVAHIAAEAMPAELTLAAAKAREIETEHAYPLLRQRSGHANRCQSVART